MWVLHPIDAAKLEPSGIRSRNLRIALGCGDGGDNHLRSVFSVEDDPDRATHLRSIFAEEASPHPRSLFAGGSGPAEPAYDHDLDQAAGSLAVMSRQMGIAGLPATCRACPIVGVCGGGDLPSRYSRHNGFDNPSVYCSDLQLIIGHIDAVLVEQTSGGRRADRGC